MVAENRIESCGHPNELLTKSVESDYQFCELCEARNRARDAETMEAHLRERQTVGCRLFVIRQRGRRLYWTCSLAHGSGWTPNAPKQAFSKSELAKEISRLIEQGWFTNCEILELSLPKFVESDPA